MSPIPFRRRHFMASLAVGLLTTRLLFATDYFVTIGGGYNPSGNQASLEANVIFFQTVLQEKHRGERVHDVYFSDGSDETADVQILGPQMPAKLPATNLIASLHRRGRGDTEQVEYRDHIVPHVAAATDPALIHASMSRIAKSAHSGDRLIVYVTSHGSEGKKSDPYNTTIDCWNDEEITVREFSRWLAEFPADVPVVMVMAQCYCGGFGHAVFEDFKVPDNEKTLAKQVRVGFFAQQHDLTAAGCRPDIDNDEEFSSYFWGAIAGRSRTGDAISGCDLDRNGTVSFAEAYAYAVVASNTIDIPLRASDVVLRTYSRIAADEDESKPVRPEAVETNTNTTEAASDQPAKKDAVQQPTLFEMTGTLASIQDPEGPMTQEIVTGLCRQLGISMQDDVTSVIAAYDKHRNERRATGRGSRRRSGSGRRELLEEISDKWPDLGDDQNWQKSLLLQPENQAALLAEIQQLPAYEAYDRGRVQRADQAAKAELSELKEVKFRRLINTLETIVLSKNLPLVATPEIVQRYRDMLALENSSL